MMPRSASPEEIARAQAVAAAFDATAADFPAWQKAIFDRRMEETEERYRNYSKRGAAPIPAKPASEFKSDFAREDRQFTADWEDPGEAYEPTAEDLEWLAIQNTFSRRESALVQLIRNRADDVMDAEAWRKSIEARERLNGDSVWIAQMLHAGGEKGFKPQHAPRAAILDLLTGVILDLPHTVGKNFIPCEAAKKRARMLISAENWCQRNPLDRFWVFHGPGRVPVGQLRITVKAIQRKLSKLNAEPFMKSAGVRLNLRIAEIGGLTFDRIRSTGEKIECIEKAKQTPDGPRVRVRLYGRKGTRWVDRSEVETVEHRDAAGQWTFYPHVNVLAHFTKGKIDNTPGPIDPKTGEAAPSDWQRFLGRIHAFWPWGWKECGGLDDIREAIKYCAKPADLRRMSAPEVCEVARALYRLHLAQPMGLLRQEIAARRNACLKLTRWRNRSTGRLEIREKPDWNARKKNRLKTPEEKKRIAERAKRRAALRRAVLNGQFATDPVPAGTQQEIDFKRIPPPSPAEFVNLVEAGLACVWPRPAAPARVGPPVVFRNRVVARMVGTSPGVPRVGPQLLVWGFDGTAEALANIRQLPFVAPMIDAALSAGRRFEPIKVHTSPVSVRALAFDTAEAWEARPDPGAN